MTLQPRQSERGPADIIEARSGTPEGRLSVIGSLLGPLSTRALNDGEVWTIAVYEVVYALAGVADGDLRDVLGKWLRLTHDAPVEYLRRVATALEEA